MKTYYKHDLKKTYLILEGNENTKEDYQNMMLRENHIPNILRTEVRCIDNQSHYYYDISGKTSFKILHEKVQLGYDTMKKLVEDLLNAIDQVQKYMLDANYILLDPEYIFCEGEQVFFCYYPAEEQDALQEFHRLTEFFVREVNYKDEEAVHFAYTIHKATMEENYSIEEILKNVTPKEETPPEPEYEEQIEVREAEHIMEEKVTVRQTLRKWFEKVKLFYDEDEEEDL